jgi:hypothetical protein
MNIIDLTGRKVNDITVVSRAGSNKDGQATWNCICVCGNTFIIAGNGIRRGYTRDCGCKKGERISASVRKHGMRHTKEYRAWTHIKDRCYRKSDSGFYLYGGRGIVVCDRWLESFENFFEDMGVAPSPKHSLDRIDNSGDYCKENCRWATIVEQARNKRNVRKITFNNTTKTIPEWAEEIGISAKALYKRVVTYGWDIERALTK